MKRKFCIILLLFLTLVFSILIYLYRISYGNHLNENSNYILEKGTYMDTNININYPQITKYSDLDKQNRLNKIIQDKAYGYLLDLSKTERNTLMIDYDYSVSWKSNKLLSIVFYGHFNRQGNTYPTQDFDTITIDIVNEKVLKLTDFYEIDKNFVKCYQNAELASVVIDKDEQCRSRNFWTVAEWSELFNNADTSNSEIHTYLTKEAIGISSEITHSIGDHVEFEILYKNLLKNVKRDGAIWEEFYKPIIKLRYHYILEKCIKGIIYLILVSVIVYIIVHKKRKQL